MDAASAALVQNFIARESRSLLQYVSDSFPWTTPEERTVLAELNAMIAEEQQAAGKLGRLLVRRQHQAPYFGTYPVSFTSINYVSLDHLLPVLIQHQRSAINQLQADLTRVAAPEAREQLQGILAMKQRHLAELEKMSSAHPEAVVR
jgi:hypothetical protein